MVKASLELSTRFRWSDKKKKMVPECATNSPEQHFIFYEFKMLSLWQISIFKVESHDCPINHCLQK